jgi:predicted RNase H-like HicB family nuclease
MTPRTEATELRKSTVILEESPEGKWTLTAPGLPGYIAFGDSEEEVLALAREGIPFHLECLREEGRDVPEGEGDAKVITLEVAA